MSFIDTSGALFRKRQSKVSKALGFHQKLMTFDDFVKHRKPLATQRCGASKKGLNKIPYETCCSLILSGPFSEKDHQKYQESITFITKS